MRSLMFSWKLTALNCRLMVVCETDIQALRLASHIMSFFYHII
jgi:hypothetical protein